MELFTQALFAESNISWTKTQYMTVIENGISSMRDKCFQAHNNALIIQSKILHDYNIIKNRCPRKLSYKNVRAPPFEIQRGIATWNNHHEIEERLEDNDIYAGISIFNFPDMPKKYFDEIRTKMSIFKNGRYSTQAQMIEDLIDNDYLDELYAF